MSERDDLRQADLRVGCAGWALASKDAARFPGEGTHLERYARVFSCVEINSSFYRPHREKTYRRWAASVPEAFRFSVKLPRTITHELRLNECETLLNAFVQEVSGLGEKLGCLLVQLPPSLALDVKVATAFFSLLTTRTHAPIVCEPRHASWFSPRGASVMREAGIACVWADPPPVAGAVPYADANPLYIRLHGSPQMYYSAYEDAFLADVASRMLRARDEGRTAWCIFDNTARGEAIPNALSLMDRLGA